METQTQFKKVFLELENLEKKIQNKEWSLIFENKQYTFENLMKSPNYNHIYNFTREIGDSVSERCTKGLMSQDESNFYQEQRLNVDYELHRMLLQVEELDRFFWINTHEVFEEFQDKIMLNLPKDPKKTFWKQLKKFFTHLKHQKPRYLRIKKS